MFSKKFKYIDTTFPKLEVEQVNPEDGLRYYIDADNNRYYSVTTVIGYKDRDKFKDYNDGGYAVNRGTLFHETIERYLKNEDVGKTDTLDQSISILFGNVKMKLNRIDNIYVQEYPLYSKTLKVAGTVDCIADYNGVPSIIDFKTSKAKKKSEWVENYREQIMAYKIMWNEWYPKKPVKQGVIIVSADDGTCEVFTVAGDDTRIERNLQTKIDYFYKEVIK